MAIPKYQYIKDELKSKIISGQFENGDKFYTEAELITMYDVSSITVVRALNELAKDGYIIRQQGKGTFVSRARKHKLVEFSDVEIFPTQTDQVTVLSIERGNDLTILDKLELKGHQFYYKIERLRKAKDIPYIYHQTYIPEQYINANYPNLEYYSSIYNRFKQDYHIHMNDEHFEETNEIIFLTPKTVATLLDIDTNFPTVFQVKTTQLESTGQILEYSEAYKRGDFFKIKFVSRSGNH
ncbi:GntR family transcriptional regulator [Streptococcus constellatus]|uniref:GntR family transcriptional regulator n=1 Tax=Streptococcus constellatus TaxID=76860 RepID=UPI0028E48246|nr:GntR family transcriptional regulator [Streptococcus constellatus]